MFLLATVAFAVAATAPPSDCRDDRGTDRCAAAEQQRMRDEFGVKPAEIHRDAGDHLLRAFYVSGYGADVVAIEFIRPRGADPQLRVHLPSGKDSPRPATMTAPVPASVWDQLVTESEFFDRELAPLPPAANENGRVSICAHSWVYTAEAADPAGRDKPATVRRRTERACGGGLTQAFAWELARTAVPLLPPCAVLKPDQHRNEASLLRVCGILAGDRIAAAEVMNRLETFRSAHVAEDLANLKILFGLRATLDWQGSKEERDAANAWLTKSVESHLFTNSVLGETSDRVRTRGILSREAPGSTLEKPRYEEAPVEQLWVRNGRDFYVEEVKVGAWVPVTFD